MLTSTSVFCRPTLYLPTQGPTLTLSNHKPTTPQYWTEPVKELCAYISQFHLKGPQLPIVGPSQCQMVQQRQSGAVEELHYMNHSRASGHWVEPHPPLSGDCQEWQWTESDACSMGNDLGYFLCLGVFGSAAVQKGTHPTLSGKEVLSGITKPQRQC